MTTATRPKRTAGKSLIDEARVTGLIAEAESKNWKIDTVVADRPHQGSLGSVIRTGRGTVKEGETYTRLLKKTRWINHKGETITGSSVMMSDTPDELRDLLPIFYAPPRGRILINGLGLGCVIKALLSLDTVDHIDVVEKSDEVIDLIGPYYECDRLSIHHDDAFTIKWPTGTRWDCVWHDIWIDLSEDNLPEMTKLHRRYGGRCDWQGSWGREFLERHRY